MSHMSNLITLLEALGYKEKELVKKKMKVCREMGSFKFKAIDLDNLSPIIRKTK